MDISQRKRSTWKFIMDGTSVHANRLNHPHFLNWRFIVEQPVQTVSSFAGTVTSLSSKEPPHRTHGTASEASPPMNRTVATVPLNAKSVHNWCHSRMFKFMLNITNTNVRTNLHPFCVPTKTVFGARQLQVMSLGRVRCVLDRSGCPQKIQGIKRCFNGWRKSTMPN